MAKKQTQQWKTVPMDVHYMFMVVFPASPVSFPEPTVMEVLEDDVPMFFGENCWFPC